MRVVRVAEIERDIEDLRIAAPEELRRCGEALVRHDALERDARLGQAPLQAAHAHTHRARGGADLRISRGGERFGDLKQGAGKVGRRGG